MDRTCDAVREDVFCRGEKNPVDLVCGGEARPRVLEPQGVTIDLCNACTDRLNRDGELRVAITIRGRSPAVPSSPAKPATKKRRK